VIAVHGPACRDDSASPHTALAGPAVPLPPFTLAWHRRHLGGVEPALVKPPSQRAIRHAWLIEQIRAVHTASRGTCGARRVHAELTLGLGLQVVKSRCFTSCRRQAPTGRHANPTLGGWLG
jgi:hypothetical protein